MTNMHLRRNDAMYINKSSVAEKCWTKSRDRGIYIGRKDYSSGKHKNSAKQKLCEPIETIDHLVSGCPILTPK